MTKTSNKLDLLTWMKGAAAGQLLSFVFETEPVPASRPRVSRWGTYYGKKYTAWRRDAYPIAATYDGPKTDKPVAVFIDTIATKPKTGKLSHPRGDVDNFVKGPLDAMTESGKFWNDDTQVVSLMTTKRYALPGETPGFYIYWYEMEEDE